MDKPLNSSDASEGERPKTSRRKSGRDEIPQPKFLSVPEAARICGVSRNTVYAWVRQGKLGAYQTPGRTNLIRPSDLVKFMHQNGMFVPSSLVELARIDDKQGHAPPRTISSEEHSHTVLVVDDDSITRSLAVRAIHDTCQVYQAETGYEALHLLTLHKDIDIVLLDLRMPGQHGTETLQEIRELRPDVAVIIITGFPGDLPETADREGMIVKTIEKPFTTNELQDGIAAAAKRLAARGQIL